MILYLLIRVLSVRQPRTVAVTRLPRGSDGPAEAREGEPSIDVALQRIPQACGAWTGSVSVPHNRYRRVFTRTVEL